MCFTPESTIPCMLPAWMGVVLLPNQMCPRHSMPLSGCTTPSAHHFAGYNYENCVVRSHTCMQLVACDSPAGRLGLSICYDLRFPELYQRLTFQEGAQVLLVPSAFTVATGKSAGVWKSGLGSVLEYRAVRGCYGQDNRPVLGCLSLGTYAWANIHWTDWKPSSACEWI